MIHKSHFILQRFNQITLICDWFYNVQCANAARFADYSNSRLADENAKLLDDEPDYVIELTGAAGGAAAEGGDAAAAGAAASGKKKRKGKKKNQSAQ